MKYLFIVILFFCSVHLMQAQELVNPKEALEILEVKQSDVNNGHELSNATAFERQLVEIYFNVMPNYLIEGTDVAASLQVCLVKALETFADNQEDVIVRHDQITLWFVKE